MTYATAARRHERDGMAAAGVTRVPAPAFHACAAPAGSWSPIPMLGQTTDRKNGRPRRTSVFSP